MTPPAGPSLDVLLTHAAFVRAAARGVLGGDGEVEDVVQETWLRALDRRPVEPGTLRGWLKKVARNLAIDRRRSSARRARREQVAARPEAAPAVADVLEREEARQRMVRALLALDAPYRDALLLRYYEGLSVPDVARRLDVPLETARTRLRRGLVLLRARLGGGADGRTGAWSLGLAPWALDRTAATAVGGVAMKKLAAAALTLALVGGGVGLSLHLARDRGAAGGAAPDLAAPTSTSAVEALEGPTLVGTPAAHERLPDPVDLASADRDRDLFGIVVDGAGQPVAGATLQIIDRPWQRGSICAPGTWEQEAPGPTTRSAVDGSFAFRLTRGARCDLRVTARGFATMDRRDCLAGQRLRLVMTPGATLVLELVADDGQSTAGTPVFLRSEAQTAPGFARDVVADANGIVRVEGLASPTRVQVRVEPVRLAMLYTHIHLPAAGELRVKVPLAVGRELRGRVTAAESGAPIAGATVALDWVRYRPVRTDAEGRFVVQGWHARQGTDELSISAPGRGTVKLVVGEREVLDVALELGDRVVGRVLGPTGGAVVAARVAVVPGGPRAGSVEGDTAQVVRSDAAGRFAFEGLRRDQEHVVVAMAPGLGRVLLDIAPHPGEPGTIDIGDIALPSGQAIEGRVLDAEGVPCPDVEVVLKGANADRRRFLGTESTTEPAFYGQAEEATTDDLGRFRFADLAPGAYSLAARRSGYPDVRTQVTLLAGKDRRDVELKLAAGRTLPVRVLDAGGRPVTSGWVEVSGGPARGNGVSVGEDGRATVFVQAGDRTLSATQMGTRPGEPALLPVWGVPIPAGGEEVVLTLVEAATIAGVVQDPSGRPLEGVSLEVHAEGKPVLTLTTGAQGRFRHQLPHGARVDLRVVALFADRQGGGKEHLPARGELRDACAGEEDLSIVATFPALDRELRVLVRAPDGKALVGARVSASSETKLWREVVTNGEGRVVIPRLTDEVWHVIVYLPHRAPDEVPWVHAPVSVRPNGQEVEVEMREAVVVTGRLVAARAEHLVGATVGLLAPGAAAVERPMPCSPSGHFRVVFHPDAPRPWVLEARSTAPAPALVGSLELDGPPTAPVVIELRAP